MSDEKRVIEVPSSLLTQLQGMARAVSDQTVMDARFDDPNPCGNNPNPPQLNQR